MCGGGEESGGGGPAGCGLWDAAVTWETLSWPFRCLIVCLESGSSGPINMETTRRTGNTGTLG